MHKKNNFLKRCLTLFLVLQLVSYGNTVFANSVAKTTPPVEEITWDKLIPEGYNANEKISELQEQLSHFRDNDPEAMMIYGNIQAELDNAPVNTSLDGKMIKMPGFIAPLDVDKDVVTEFLLVPYYGACIHLPPPPMNQTVLIKTNKGQGIKFEDVNLPVWITGILRAVDERTDIGTAGYRIENAKVDIYKEKK